MSNLNVSEGTVNDLLALVRVFAQGEAYVAKYIDELKKTVEEHRSTVENAELLRQARPYLDRAIQRENESAELVAKANETVKTAQNTASQILADANAEKEKARLVMANATAEHDKFTRDAESRKAELDRREQALNLREETLGHRERKIADDEQKLLNKQKLINDTLRA